MYVSYEFVSHTNHYNLCMYHEFVSHTNHYNLCMYRMSSFPIQTIIIYVCTISYEFVSYTNHYNFKVGLKLPSSSHT